MFRPFISASVLTPYIEIISILVETFPNMVMRDVPKIINAPEILTVQIARVTTVAI